MQCGYVNSTVFIMLFFHHMNFICPFYETLHAKNVIRTEAAT